MTVEMRSRETNGRFAPEHLQEHPSASNVLGSSLVHKDVQEHLGEFKAYFQEHDVLSTFSQDSLEVAGPDEEEVFSQIESDTVGAQLVVRAAVAESGACAMKNIPADETALNVAEAAYEAWQQHLEESAIAHFRGKRR